MRIRSRKDGVSAVEFALLTVVWVPLILGTLAVGVNLVRALQTTHIARDMGHMYALGVDFSQTANQTLAVRLGQEIGMKATGDSSGDGVLILTTVTFVGRQACKSQGFADNAHPPNVDVARCLNYRHWVYVHRAKIGNTALRQSALGDPPNSLMDATTGKISPAAYVANTTDRADGFATFPNAANAIPAPADDEVSTDGYQAGQSVFVVESFFRVVDFPGFVTNTGANAYAIF
jgi:hypothetical protein